MSTLRMSYLSAIATAVVLLTTAPLNASPTGAATSNMLAGMGGDPIVQVAHRNGGPAIHGGGPSFRGGPAFHGGPRFGGPRFGARQFHGNQFAWRGRNFRNRRFAALPFFYDYPGYGYCRRVLQPLLTPSGHVVMRWVRSCPDIYHYGYDSYWW